METFSAVNHHLLNDSNLLSPRASQDSASSVSRSSSYKTDRKVQWNIPDFHRSLSEGNATISDDCIGSDDEDVDDDDMNRFRSILENGEDEDGIDYYEHIESIEFVNGGSTLLESDDSYDECDNETCEEEEEQSTLKSKKLTKDNIKSLFEKAMQRKSSKVMSSMENKINRIKISKHYQGEEDAGSYVSYSESISSEYDKELDIPKADSTYLTAQESTGQEIQYGSPRRSGFDAIKVNQIFHNNVNHNDGTPISDTEVIFESAAFYNEDFSSSLGEISPTDILSDNEEIGSSNFYNEAVNDSYGLNLERRRSSKRRVSITRAAIKNTLSLTPTQAVNNNFGTLADDLIQEAHTKKLSTQSLPDKLHHRKSTPDKGETRASVALLMAGIDLATAKENEIRGNMKGNPSVITSNNSTDTEDFIIDQQGHVTLRKREENSKIRQSKMDKTKKRKISRGNLAATVLSVTSMFARAVSREDLSQIGQRNEKTRSSFYTGESKEETNSTFYGEKESSPGPTPRKGVSGLRDCDSLENVSSITQQTLIGNGVVNKAVSSAVSLPQIHRLSDDEDHDDDDAQRTNSLERPRHLHSKPNSGRSSGAKQQAELRKRAIYRTHSDDGRSKSLTHLNTLGGNSGPDGEMLLNADAIDGGPNNDGHLGVPDHHNSLRRRRLISSGKVLSDEYVMVVLECLPEPLEEIVSATRGITLRTCLERLQVDGSLCQVFLEGSRTPLDLSSDINLLGGKTVRVRARDESRSPIRYQRPTSTPGTITNRKPSNVRARWGTSQEDALNAENERNSQVGTGSQEGSLKVNKQNKHGNRWSIFPSNSKDVKMDLLVQQLDLYSRQGIPQLPSGFNTTHLDPLLESSWQELVDDPDQLDDRQQQQQLAIWELVTTEATHIHMLKVITDLFLACIRSLQNETLLNEIDTEKLFSNIQEIYAANVTFWQEHIIKMVEHSRNTRQPLDPSMLSEGFYKFDEILQPYTRYCMEQSNCHLYCKEKDFENEYFKTYLAWCETQKECNRLRLADILVRPMQRLTKYTLLLKAIAKKTTLEDHKILLGEMVSHVDSYVSNVNSALRNRHEQQKLRDIENRIDSYDVVESRDDDLERVVKKYSDLNLTQPMPGCPEHLARNILHHGDLKLRDHTIGKMEVHVFLFTDILLITKVTQKKGERVKIIRPPYHVARLIIVDVKDVSALGLVYINEWNVAVAAFTLQCHDPRAHRVWVEQIRKAQEQYRDAKQRKDNLVLEELYGTHLIDRTPRIGSSRASRGSSLAHSHSGSMELDPASPISTLRGGHQVHQQSTEQSDMRGSNIDFRASSASSEDSGSHSAEVQRSRSLESGSNVPSTRPDYRPSQAKTANTLTVRTPYSTGQSLPNLDVEASQSLRVPPTSSSSSSHKLLSNSARGISYPPHSPRTLRRLAPVPQSRNPPLVKSRNISGIPQLQEEAIDQENIPRERTRRMMRNDRNDNRRYHTAGVVDDIKKQDTKDTAIHKRLSLNYGKGAPVSNKPLQLSCTLDSDHRLRMKHRSCESIQSSSGVSSTSSLHSRSMGSELETLELIDDTEFEGDISGTIVDLEVTDCTNLKLSPHISSTYISAHTDVTLGSGCHQYVMHTNQTTQQNADSNESTGTLKIDVSESSPGISSVQITVSDRVTTSATEAYVNDSEHWNSTEPNFRDILLNDANIESSDV